MAGKWTDSQVKQLIALIAKKDNYKVLYGTEAGENTIGDTKSKVHARIAEDLGFVKSTGTARVKRKLEDLQRKFKELSKRLKRTGEGVHEDGLPEYYYIHIAGPDHDTPAAAVNIWNSITETFSYFPDLYRLWATRPNFIPICATTALTPAGGPATTLIQATQSATVPRSTHTASIPIVPTLLEEDRLMYDRRTAEYTSFFDIHDDDSTPSTPAIMPSTPITRKEADKENVRPTSTSAFHSRSASFKSALAPVAVSAPRKRGIEDEIADAARGALKQLATQGVEAEERKRRRLALDEEEFKLKARELLRKEYEDGLLTPDEYREERRALISKPMNAN